MYYDAVSVLRQIKQHKGSIKSLVFANHTKNNSKQVFALVCETLKYSDIIDVLIKKCNIADGVKALKKDEWLTRVLVYDLVFGRGLHGKFKVLLGKHKVSLQSELARMKIKAKVSTNKDLLAAHGYKKESVPRYVRVNSLNGVTTNEIIQQLSTKYLLVSADKCNYDRFIDAIKNLKDDQFIQDVHIPHLLIFTSSSNIHHHQLYKDGKIIFQDKASCLPAFVLSGIGVPLGSHVIDCCAAPGNKTSHMADILNNSGKIFAFDKDPGRIEIMKKLLQQAGTTCIEVTNKDFLSVDPLNKKYSDVQYSIVDPSCSGSGIVNRLNQLTDSDDSCSKERLQKLSNFQIAILKHALSFPSMQYAVYSTCSVHEEENEQVLEKVLNETGGKFELIKILPAIPHRGLTTYTDIGPLCVRLNADKDCTNGFFVACLKRKDNNSSHIETDQINIETDISNIEETDVSNIETELQLEQKSICTIVNEHIHTNDKLIVNSTSKESDGSYNFKKIKKKIKIGKKRKITWDDDDNEEVEEEIMQSIAKSRSNNKRTEVDDGKNAKPNSSKKIKKSKVDSLQIKLNAGQNSVEESVNTCKTHNINAENIHGGRDNNKKRKKKKKHSTPVTR